MFSPKENQPRLLVGLMSGTSADGIDAVVARISGGPGALRAQVAAHIARPFPSSLRRRVIEASAHGTVAEICELNFLLGKYFAKAALAVIRAAGLRPGKIAAIGSHGQTVHHLPSAATPSTLQIGEPAVIAELTGITTVADFRVRDMAAGGQGAPLVPFADWALFTSRDRPRIVQNIGGIGNFTFLPQRADLASVLACDTGPGNMVIDAMVARLSHNRLPYDRNGAWAAREKPSARLLKSLMSHPFLKRPPPKTTGREEFGEDFASHVLYLAKKLRLTKDEIVATVTVFTAATIADAYRRFIFPKINRTQLQKVEVILGGGGAKNRTLRRFLAEELEARSGVRAKWLTSEDFGIALAAKEALAFALLAHETLCGRPGNVPSATGAKKPVILGKIALAR